MGFLAGYANVSKERALEWMGEIAETDPGVLAIGKELTEMEARVLKKKKQMVDRVEDLLAERELAARIKKVVVTGEEVGK